LTVLLKEWLSIIQNIDNLVFSKNLGNDMTNVTPITTTEYIKNLSYNEQIEPDRFTQITGNNNYRSGRIVSKNQLELLKKKYGIKNIINLAKDSMYNQQDPSVPCNRDCEPYWAEMLGMNYYPYYLSDKPPSDQMWANIKEILAQGNTLIHCTWGVDRTGTIAGAWRKTVEPNLANDDVLNYTYSFGGQWKSSGDPNRYLRNWLVNVQYDPNVKVKYPYGALVYVGVGVVSIPIIWFLFKKFRK
jgi:protein tyrosine/serine phosphatase